MKPITGTSYFIDKSQRVYRALKAKVINGKTYYYLKVDGRLKRYSVAELSTTK